MQKLTEIIKFNGLNNIGITGLTDGFFGFYLSNLYCQKDRNIIVVVNSLYEANKLYSIVSSFLDDVFLFPMDDFLTSEAVAMSPDLLINRMETLKNISISNKKCIVITNLMGYLRYLPTKKEYLSSIVELSVGSLISPADLFKKMCSIGYERETIVTNTGEVGLRGFVVDVFPIGEDNPVRIEFFGDEIESIRYFDSNSQKSISDVNKITIYPYFEFLTNVEVENEKFGKQKYLPDYTNVSSIIEYLDNSYTIFKDYSQLEVSYKNIVEEMMTYQQSRDTNYTGKYMFSLYDIVTTNNIYYMNLNNISKKNLNEIINYDVHSIDNFNENEGVINTFIHNSIDNNKTVLICLKDYQLKNIEKNIDCSYKFTDFNNIYDGIVNLIDSNLDEGFIYDNYVFLTSRELFINREENKKYKTKFKYSTKITDINKLQIGDYVVHNVHGIGIYHGIKKLSINGMDKDYIEVVYQGKDKLYIPVEKIDNLNKFSGKEGMVPKVNKLSGTDWQKTKTRVSKKVADMADELIKLYAERESRRGFAFSKDNDLMRLFEKAFPYELTKDQQLSINQIKLDMEKPQPMDRLLCGDVGFGKTEVAFVAAFKAICDSKQVLFLCPTTILSNQHYKNALTRFKGFPVNIALFNRFTTTTESNRIIEGLKDGTIDMVIGTHRLLNDRIMPRDLGLLIIDEEQRFGVKHKEKIKQYKSNVDVLTLTATPIPRTLQMSMTGIRSLSLIETPPVNRYPVQTYVIEENNQIIKDAIYKELSRDGQVFLLYNNVENIEKKVFEIKKLVPDARVLFAHGQMSKEVLENRMIDFIHHKFDVLVCTTIIETGIDIPNVNTLIILDADHFGLSQLYQIRGRVGRSNKFAYAYLMYQPFKNLTETAIKRLNVIKEFTELGSGFSIATRDLSIRGAGDILGSEQAGFIDSVGIDLYLKMLNNEISRRKGEKVEEDDDDLKPLINVSTHIKDSYISDEDLKIEIHRKINTIDSNEKFNSVKAEIEDRFGSVDEDMIIYMYEEWFEKLANKIPLNKVLQTKNSIELIFEPTVVEKINIETLFVDSFKITNMFRFQKRGNNLVIILDIIKLEKHPIYYLVELLQLILKLKS